MGWRLMEGRYPKGILFLLSNCKDPSLDLDFNYWYSNVYLPHLMASGTFQQATRYRNTEHRSKTSDAEYMAILETDSEDLYGAMGDFKERAKKLANKHGMHVALEEVVAAVFRATGPEFRAGPEARNSTGSMLLLSNCKDESNEREFNHWYDTVHIPHVIESGRYHTAYRYESIDPRPTHGKYIAIYETDNADPGKLAASMARERPQWIEKGLYSPDIERVMRASYSRI
jgi:hypothetical protein